MNARRQSTTPKFQMPERHLEDGVVVVRRATEFDTIEVSVERANCFETLRMSEYNAWRLLGCLSVLLGLPLSKEVGKAIKL